MMLRILPLFLASFNDSDAAVEGETAKLDEPLFIRFFKGSIKKELNF